MFVRVADGWAYACDVNPRAGPSPTHATFLRWQLDGALDAGPLRHAGEDDATYAARRAYQQRVWDGTA